MASTLLLIFICLSCLMFLGMLYGEKLNLLGLTESLWIMPVGDVFSRLWNGLTEAVDESIEFVLAHLSWVVATMAGTAGLLLIIFLMGGGLTADAAAFHRDALTPLKSGGVIDKVPEVSSRSVPDLVQLASAELDDSQFVTQAISRDYFVFGRPEYTPVRPRPRRPIDGGVIDVTDNRPLSGRTQLDVTFRRLGSTMIRELDVPTISIPGKPLDTWPDDRFVDRAVARLLRDNWRESTGLVLSPDDGVGQPGETLMDSPAAAVRDLESRVRFSPGMVVAQHDVRVEKTFPAESATGEITMQVTLTNLSNDTISGLLVREILPLDTLVRGASPEAVLRGGTLTWLVDELRPSRETQFRFTVIPPRSTGRLRMTDFESVTEVSAVTAVKSRTVVEEESSLPEPFPSDSVRPRPRPPEIAGRPDLRMSISEPTASADVGKWTTLTFTIRNAGNAAADDVAIRLQLAPELDHHALLNSPPTDREVIVNVRRLRAGESQDFELEVRPREAGEILSTAELLHEEAQVDMSTFQVVARDVDERPPFDSDSAIQ